MDTIFIDRNRRRDILRVNQLMEKALRAGKSVMFFPEGTTTDGARILPFKSGLLEPAAKTQTPVAYASLHYQTLPQESSAALSVCWWGDMNFLPHLLGLFGLSQVNATLQFGAATKQAVNRKLLAKELQVAVQEIFIPVLSATEATKELIIADANDYLQKLAREGGRPVPQGEGVAP